VWKPAVATSCTTACNWQHGSSVLGSTQCGTSCSRFGVDRQWTAASVPRKGTTANAEVVLMYYDFFGPSQIWVNISTDGGARFGPPVEVLAIGRVDALTAQIDQLAARIEKAIAPFAAQVARLDEIPGIGVTTAQEILAETGTDMSRFPTPGHLVSWAKFAPKARQSAGRSKAAATGKGNPWLGGTIGEAAIGAARTSTFLAARYKRVVKRRGKKRALVAVGNSILTICWHLLSDPGAHFTDLGPDWHDRLAPQRRKRQLIAELERLSGKKVTLNDAA
jgi:Transposase IS116/IS110/IS902 family